jgi:hypothetical protein
MLKVQALIMFQEDFQKRSFFDWVVSHITGSLPPHRYAGNIEITDKCIRFIGYDTKQKCNAEFILLKERIREVFYGYDKIYNIFQTRGLGLMWAPVRLKFTDESDSAKVLYIITGYEIQGTTNKDFYLFLQEWLS